MTDDYAPLARGGLKLKGASKPAGITKKKKKKAKEASTDAPSEPKKSALQKALHEEDSPKNPAADSAVELSEDQLKELEDGDPHDGKTPAERAMEEMRRKRVRFPFPSLFGIPHLPHPLPQCPYPFV
jgi:hypothetical protein